MKSVTIPPFYFISGIVIISLSYQVFPGLNVIPFSYNLTGLLLLFTGFYLLSISYQLFNNYNTTHNFRKSTALATNGLFSHTRNPMYVGMTIVLAGIAVCFGNIISMSVPFFS